jgi:hypothetical protein
MHSEEEMGSSAQLFRRTLRTNEDEKQMSDSKRDEIEE